MSRFSFWKKKNVLLLLILEYANLRFPVPTWKNTWAETCPLITDFNLVKLKRNDVNAPLISRFKADLMAATGMNSHQFLFYSTVLFRRQSTSGCAASHEQLNVADMIQILNKSSGDTAKFIYASEDHFDNLAFYVVGSLAVASNGSIWAAVRKCCDNVTQIPNFLKPSLVSATIRDLTQHALFRFSN